MNNSQIPIARKDGLVIQEMPEEVLVYDLDTNKAHCLNQTAAFVWNSCNGSNTVTDITKLLVAQSDFSINEDMIWLALEQLSNENLLENKLTPIFEGQSRREVLKKIGLAAVIALPVVASLTAPSNILAQTSCMCMSPGDCIAQPSCPNPNNCNPTGICAP